jgi:RNA polymerase sigma-70 factor (ECF subfamily)
MDTTSESLLFRLQSPAISRVSGVSNSNRLDSSTDQSAWKRFVEIYTPLIFYWARKTGLGQADSADLVQEVLTLVFRKLPEFQYDKNRSFRGWLRTLTINKYREARRRKSAGMKLASASMLEELAPVASAESTWDFDYAKSLVAETMRCMKADFAPSTWEALTLVFTAGKSVEQAANETGVSNWTIYSAKSRLMKRLRTELSGLL